MDKDKPKKIQIVGPVNTNLDNPWRTQGDYKEEQAKLLRAYRWAVASSIAAIIAALSSVVLAYVAIQQLKTLGVKQVAPVQVEKSEKRKNL